jgi:hypothetical protein
MEKRVESKREPVLIVCAHGFKSGNGKDKLFNGIAKKP